MRKRIESLDFLKAFLVLVVLVVHYCGTICFDDVSSEKNPALFWFTSILSGFFRGNSVPIYFVISGYLFFLNGRFSMEEYYRKLRRRIKSLLIPYIIWNTLAIIMLVIVLLSPFVSMMKYGEEVNLSIGNILSCYWIYDGGFAGVNIPTSTAPINMPLWYIRDLIVMVLLSPAIYWLLKKLGIIFLSLMCVLWIYYSIETASVYVPREALFFFSLGAYFSVKGKDMVSIFSRFLKSSTILYLLVSIILGIVFFYEIENWSYLNLLNIVIGVVFYISFFEYLSHGSIINTARKYFDVAFFIYLSHGLICSKMIKLIMILLKPSSDFGYIMTDVLSYIISILLLYGVYMLIKRLTPRVLSVMLGR